MKYNLLQTSAFPFYIIFLGKVGRREQKLVTDGKDHTIVSTSQRNEICSHEGMDRIISSRQKTLQNHLIKFGRLCRQQPESLAITRLVFFPTPGIGLAQ